MLKRLSGWLLCLVMLAGILTPAQAAGIDTLDRALSRWLEDQTSIRFSATMQLKTLLPYNEDTIVLMNNVLKHVNINAVVEQDADNSLIDFELLAGGKSMMTYTQRMQNGTHTLQTSLLPNRTLTSGRQAPWDALAAAMESVTPVAPAAQQSEPEEASANASDIAQGFSILDAVADLQTTYKALTDGIQPYTEEKRANYNIKSIGAGKWSRIARLTEEQSAGLQSELRAVLACGMDDIYREEIANVTFAKGFLVALYQNADKQDICVYMKGDIIYPDGAKRKLVWQWAFSTNGLKRKDVFKYEVSKHSGTADSRVIAANSTQESRSEGFDITTKSEITLKRAKITDKSTERIELSGVSNADNAVTCKGTVSQELAQTISGETTKNTTSSNIDIAFTPSGDQSILSGTVGYSKMLGKVPQTEVEFAFAQDAQPVTASTGADVAIIGSSDGPTVAIIGQQNDDSTAPDQAIPASSIDQLDDLFEEEPAETQAPPSDYLVGTPPIGITAITAPQSPTTVDVDSANADALSKLSTELLQNLAGKLIVGIANLPGEDGKLMGDGMTEKDYAAFLTMIGEL